MATKSKFTVKHGLAVHTQSGSTPTLNYPTTDGSINQFIKTDGSGNLTFDSSVSSFINLTDTPVNFDSAASRFLRVDSTGTAVEFSDVTMTSNVSRESFTASGNSSVITLANTYVGDNYLLVFVDGVIQFPGTNYSLDSTVLTFTAIPDSDSRIEVFGTSGNIISVPGDTTVSAAKLTNPLALPDNHEISFGNGGKGKIVHTGSKLQLFETTGGIDIRTYANDQDITISSDDGTGGIANYIIADGSTGEAQLFHYGSQKLATKSTGVDVTGSLIADSATFNGTTAIKVPAGTTGQRPSAVTGQIRFNSSLASFEGYHGSSWNSLGGIVDVDQDTKITAENTAGADSDALKFFTGGTLRMTLDGDTLQFAGDSPGINTLSNANIDLDPNGSGQVVFKGNGTKGSGQFVLNCENNSHGITIKGPPHSAGASYTLTLPDSDGYAGSFLKSNGSGNLSWATGGTDVVVDTTPQLGGDLDGNNKNITNLETINVDSATTKLIRMDSAGSPVSLSKSGATFGGYNLKVTSNGGYVQIGPLNASYSHFTTDRDRFYFNKKIIANGAVSSYNQNLELQRNEVTKLSLIDSGVNVTGRIYALGGSLDSSAGSEVELLDLHSTVVNGSRLRVFTKRDSAGTSWTGAYTRIQQRTDVSDQSYIQFNGADNNWGMELGNTNEKFIRMVRNGAVEIYHDNSLKLITTATGVDITGALTATTKSFDIEHPTKEGMRLRYGSLEGPENGVYVRGKLENSNIIELPDYWTGLVDENTITVSLTPIGKYNEVWIDKIEDNKVYINSSYNNIQCFYHVFGERKDVDKLQVEYE